MKKIGMICGAIISLIVVASYVWQGLSWAADKAEQLDQVVENQKMIAQMQQQQMSFQDRLFEYTMNLWQIDPETRNKWKQISAEPPLIEHQNDTVDGVWREFDGNSLILYHLKSTPDGDSMVFHLSVDTLYVWKGESP